MTVSPVSSISAAMPTRAFREWASSRTAEESAAETAGGEDVAP
jgi:hypothetical protein